MSSEESEFSDNVGFTSRFIEVCGTDRAVQVQKVLDISNQAARNYLAGRLPDAQHLMLIAEKTPYSIHWLLTGRGKKFAIEALNQGTPLSTHQLGELVMKVTMKVMNEIDGSHDVTQSNIVTLHPDNVYSEKTAEGSAARSESSNEQPESTDEDSD
jgi:hypothetical protein